MPDGTTAPSVDTAEKFVVRYRYGKGILLDGNTLPFKDKIKSAWPRWRWFPSLRQWGVQRSRNRALSRVDVEQYANGLRTAGVPNVEVDYDAPKNDDLSARTKLSKAEQDKRLAEIAAKQEVTPEESWPQIFKVNEILVDAERQGLGAQMSAWLRKNRIQSTDTVAEAYGYARGVVALERGSWPPPPTRGSYYGKDHFKGLLSSLEHHVVVAELMKVAEAWPKQMKAVTKGRSQYWFDYGRIARTAVQCVRDIGLMLPPRMLRVKRPTLALARQARDSAVESATSQLARLKTLLDPTLYDPSSAVEDVYPRLCEIDPQAAGKILSDVFGVEFPIDRDAAAYSLCGGDTTLEGVQEKANKEAEKARKREVERDALDLADARDLIAVGADAVQRGEFTPRRFNAAYKRLHPNMTERQRERRAMTLFTAAAGTRARVSGPRDAEFVGPFVQGSKSDAIAALWKRVKKAAGSTESTTADNAERRKESGRMWSVDQEGFALTSPRGEGPRVVVPSGPQPSLLDMGPPDRAVLERQRAEELADRHGASKDEAAPLLDNASREPTPTTETPQTQPKKPEGATCCGTSNPAAAPAPAAPRPKKTRTKKPPNNTKKRSTVPAGKKTKKSSATMTPSEKRKARAERRKSATQERERKAAERTAQRLQCSATAAEAQARTIDLDSYRKRVATAGNAVKKAERNVAKLDKAMATARRGAAAVRGEAATPKDRRAAQKKVVDARCALRIANSKLTQRKRDHRRSITELRTATTRVKKRQAVATSKKRRAERARSKAAALGKIGK